MEIITFKNEESKISIESWDIGQDMVFTINESETAYLSIEQTKMLCEYILKKIKQVDSGYKII